MSNIIFVTGAPGAGKSTIGRQIAKHYHPKSIHIQVDQLHGFMVNGIALPDGKGFPAEGEHQLKLARTVAIDMAKLYASDGCDVVIDDVCIPEIFAVHYSALFGASLNDQWCVHKVMLMPQQDVLNARILERGGPYAHIFLKDIPWIYSILESIPKRGWIVIDSSQLTIDETTDEVLNRIKLNSAV